MKQVERNTESDFITQDNTLIEASYTLTLNEKRLLLLGASKIDSRTMPRKDEPLEFDVTVSEWLSWFPCDDPFRAMKRAADKMLTRYVTLHPKTGVTKKISWFDSVEYHDGEGRVTIRFGWSVSLRLAGMISEFTKINLLGIEKLSSFHSVRMYELVKQFSNTGARVMTVEDFRIAMDCVNSYSDMKELKRRVLTPSVKDVDEKSDLSVVCIDQKKGRSIVGFKFLITEKK